ncbi:hypothetical protein [Helicobacter sp. T3_23-1059]
MKKLSLVIFVAILGFVACGDSSNSKDSGESNNKSTQDSQDLRESKKIKG